jgi:hypothetical protein
MHINLITFNYIDESLGPAHYHISFFSAARDMLYSYRNVVLMLKMRFQQRIFVFTFYACSCLDHAERISTAAFSLKSHDKPIFRPSRRKGGLLGDSVIAKGGGWTVEQLFYPNIPESLLQRDKESVETAVYAVVKACHISAALQPSEKNGGISTFTKTDLSPVTVADFAVQAVVLQHLFETFPCDEFVAEEDAIQLKRDDSLAKQVLQATGMNSLGDLCHAVNLGSGKRDNNDQLEKQTGSNRRIWCLDPIDGTRGFLRGKEQGGQFCVALALLEVRI